MMHLRPYYSGVVMVVVLALGVFMPEQGECNVTGPCDNCHVMHASIQSEVTPNPEGPQSFLMRDTCLGCHNATGGGSGAPYVLADGNKDTIDLAGGDFAYAFAVSSKGHNPVGFGALVRVEPPGWTEGFSANDQVGGVGAVTWDSQLTCDGVWGCHGRHTSAAGIKGGHHNNASGLLATPSDVGNSYRFLYGIKGKEDANYETTGGYNIYYGVDRNNDTMSTSSGTPETQTISYLCAECHGIFHSGNGTEGVDGGIFASPWIRHPVDISMRTTGEYGGYAYSSEAPVASSDFTLDPVASVNRIVMCLSCHRAHASPYPASMRWDYLGAGGYLGCAKCHTSKN